MRMMRITSLMKKHTVSSGDSLDGHGGMLSDNSVVRVLERLTRGSPPSATVILDLGSGCGRLSVAAYFLQFARGITCVEISSNLIMETSGLMSAFLKWESSRDPSLVKTFPPAVMVHCTDAYYYTPGELGEEPPTHVYCFAAA